MKVLYFVFILITPMKMLTPDQVFFWPIKPFIYYKRDNSLDGILPFMYKRLQELCCPLEDLAEYHLINKTFNENSFYETLGKVRNKSKDLKNYTGNNGIWFPLLIVPDQDILKRQNLTKDFFIYSPNIGVIANKYKLTIPNKLREAIIKSLPIALHAFGLTLIFSLLVWLAESVKSNDFSKCFVKGIGTSIWWSFVTLATVGYGDIVPKSLLGRALSIIWMVIGIILVSGLTGIFSSTFITNSFLSIQNRKIAVLNNSKEFEIARKNYNITAKKVYSTYDEVLKDIDENKVDYGVINVDVLLNMEYKKHYSDVVLVQLLDAGSPVIIVFGIDTYLMSTAYQSKALQNDEIFTCLYKLNRNEILKNIQQIYGKIPIIDTEVQQNFGDFFKEMYVKGFGIVVLIIIGFLALKDGFYFICKIYDPRNHTKIDKKPDIMKSTDTPLKIFSNDNPYAEKDFAEHNNSFKELLVIK